LTERGDPFEEPSRYLLSHDPSDIAEKAGVDYSGGSFEIPLLKWKIGLTHPGLAFEMPDFLSTFTVKLLTLLYLSRADGVPLSNQWVPYRELPDGLFYSKSFSDTVEERLKDHFDGKLEALLDAAGRLGCSTVSQGDAGLVFNTFPRISLLFIYWKADEEFPASANILFDASASHYLNVFELKMLASEVVTRLIAIANGKLAV
jgi:hypothetical protein